jgi:hypothetical protein
MTFMTWNINYWERTCDNDKKYYKTNEQIIEWKNNSIDFLKKFDYDFMLLQEINPFFYFGEISNPVKSPYQYLFNNLSGRQIYYHELVDEIKKDGWNDPRKWWGTAIITNNNRKYINYSKRNDLMFYDFEIENGEIITVINLYNKGIYAKQDNGKYYKDYYITLETLIKSISDLIENRNNLIILAGDFNGSVQSTKYYPSGNQRYKELFGNIVDLGFINFTECLGTTVSYTNYQNDYFFIKNYNGNIKIVNKYLYENISDHYLITCAIEI